MAKDEWIIDGNYHRNLETRFIFPTAYLLTLNENAKFLVWFSFIIAEVLASGVTILLAYKPLGSSLKKEEANQSQHIETTVITVSSK